MYALFSSIHPFDAWSTKADDDGSFAQYKTLDRRGSGVMIKPYLRSSVQINLRTDRDMGRVKSVCERLGYFYP